MAPRLATTTVAGANSALLAIPLDSTSKIPAQLKSVVEKLFGLILDDEISVEKATGQAGEITEISVAHTTRTHFD